MQDYTTLTHEELFNLGYEEGKQIVSINQSELPVIGYPECNAEDAEEWREEVRDLAFEAEQNSRQFSPFEFFAKDLNDREDADEAWDSYDEGIAKGVQDSVDGMRPWISEPYARERVKDMLDETHGTIQIGSLEYQPSQVLENTDPAAFWQVMLEWLDAEGLELA